MLNSGKIYLLTVLLYASIASFAQGVKVPARDSINSAIILLEKIPVASVKAQFELSRIAQSLITEQQLEAEKVRNDSILSVVDRMLSRQKTRYTDHLLTRDLSYQIDNLRKYQGILTKEEKKLQNIIEALAASNLTINHTQNVWTQTRTFYASNDRDTLISNSVDHVITQTDSVKRQVSIRTQYAISLLSRTSKYTLKIETALTNLLRIRKNVQQTLFESNYPPVYALHFFDFSQLRVKTYLSEFVREDRQVLVDFFHENQSRFLYYFIFLVVFIVALVVIYRKSKVIELEKPNLYQQSALAILKRPISLAIIFWIFASGFFFNIQPPIFQDMGIVILVIPIVDILAHVARKSNSYLVVFAVLVLLRFATYIFPPSSLLNRYILLIMGILEVLFLARLLRSIDLKSITSPIFHRLVFFIIWLHLTAAVVGLVTTLSGQMRIAEIAIDLSISNTLVGIMLIISAITIIGFLQLFVDAKQARCLKFLQKRKELLKKRTVLIVMLITALLWIHYMLQMLRLSKDFYHVLDTVLNHRFSLGTLSFSL